MHQVFSHHDTATVGLIDGILKDSGIETFIRNWAGSNITEIPIPAIYPAVCVLKESDIPAARRLIQEFFKEHISTEEEWTCSHCGETVDGFLSECWSCQQPRKLS